MAVQVTEFEQSFKLTDWLAELAQTQGTGQKEGDIVVHAENMQLIHGRVTPVALKLCEWRNPTLEEGVLPATIPQLEGNPDLVCEGALYQLFSGDLHFHYNGTLALKKIVPDKIKVEVPA